MKKTSPVLATLLLTTALLPAIERPGAAEDKLPTPPARQAAENPAAGEAGAWLGVAGYPIDELLAWHLGLDHGVALEMVAPDSPAAAAGLEARDIITRVGGEKISSQEDLREVITKHKTGDEVTLSLVRKGIATDQKVTLVDRPANLAGPADEPQPFRFQRGLRGEFPDLLEKEIERHFRDMRQPGLGRMDPELNKMLQQLPNGNGFNLNLRARSSFTVHDDQGSIEIREVNDSREVVVKDKDGKTLFEGPYLTPQDKAAVPDSLRERVGKIDFKGSDRIRLRFNDMRKNMNLDEKDQVN